DAVVHGLGSLEKAVAGEITFLANPKYADKVGQTAATAVIMPPGGNCYGKNVIETDKPQLAFAKLLGLFYQPPSPAQGVMPGAHVSPTAELGCDITVYPGAYIGDGVKVGDRVVIHPNVTIYAGCSIGDDVTLHANVSIRERCRVGSRVIVHNGTVIGSDGFGYVPDGTKHVKVPQVGIVVIEDDVEIGANVTIDRAALEQTVIGKGTKIDNLVQIAHNVIIGENCIIVAQAGIAGSAILGNSVILGGQTGVVGHISICDNVMIGAQSGVSNNVKEPGVYSGSPTMPHKEWLKMSMTLPRLPEMRKSVTDLEKRVSALEAK
ncbi:MAG TPA: UDP-3-O-(3-hydroxymyristoyl)glucosamine N-acyltransferase, partial [Geobacteraceae bacterium]|nr:UDP-3-O-(3-hydroxymyristoyl)glucosamine N-acyltransferase [Geobacteraceae bacterium]